MCDDAARFHHHSAKDREHGGPSRIGCNGYQDVTWLDLADLGEVPAHSRAAGNCPVARTDAAKRAFGTRLIVVERLPAANVLWRFLVSLLFVHPTAFANADISLALA